MPFLTFLPNGPSPAFFLWAPASCASDSANFIVRALVSIGEPASACVVGARRGAASREPGCSIGLLDALPILAAVPWDRVELLPGSIAAWSAAAKLALELIARGRMVPSVSADRGGRPGELSARWRVSLAMPGDADRAAAIAAAMPPAAHAVPVAEEDVAVNRSLGAGGMAAGGERDVGEVWAPDVLLRAFLDAAADAIVRASVALRVELQDAAEPRSTRPSGARASPRLGADRRAPWELRFVFALVSEDAVFDPAGSSGLSVAPEISAWARPAIEDASAWPRADLLSERSESACLIEATGSRERRLQLRMRIDTAPKAARSATLDEGVPQGEPATSGHPTPEWSAGFDLQTALRFRWEVALGTDILLREDLDEIGRASAPIARFRGVRIEVSVADLAESAALVAQGGGLVPACAGLRAALDGSIRWPGVSQPIEVIPTGAFAAAIHSLSAAREAPLPSIPRALRMPLRPHEHRGFAWLARMASLGLGACLADGPGIDKAIQVVAFLQHRREVDPADRRPVLVLCPMPAERDWRRAIARIMPSLLTELTESGGAAVVLASHARLLDDAGALTEVAWSTVVLDDASRAGEAVHLAVQRLRARRRIALTAMPVEDRMEDLVSVIELVSPGLLGSREELQREIVLPIERFHDPGASDRLARLARTFVLRRRSGDPDVVRDREVGDVERVTCALMREQAALYQSVAVELMRVIEGSRGERRRDLVRSLVASLRQICDHPAYYMEQPELSSGRSGKLIRLGELLDEVIAAGERAIVIAETSAMSELLAAELMERLGSTPVLLFERDLSRAARASVLARFGVHGGPPAVVVTSSASAVELDVEAAEHVFGFDRGSMLLVDEAASAQMRRAARLVALVTAGTIEERIWDQASASSFVPSKGAWLADLDDAALRDAVLLSASAIVAQVTDRAEAAPLPGSEPPQRRSSTGLSASREVTPSVGRGRS